MRRENLPRKLVVLAVFGLGVLACGDSGGKGGGTGGSGNIPSSSGGSAGGGTGGGPAGAGGSTMPSGSGGVAGSPGLGGVQGSGGSTSGAGGVTTGTGGRGTGGTAAGTGGRSPRDAAVGSGGSPRPDAAIGGQGGAGGTSTGTIDGGGGPGGSAKPSSGCGKTPPAATTARLTIDVGGTAREYVMAYPTSYDPNHPYRVIYEFHGSGGTAEENVRFKWYGVEPLAGGSVIFVAPQGLGSPAGWPNTNGQDIAFVKQLVTYINSTFCVDTSRIFVDGFSYGAMFSNTLGCQMGDVFRGIAPASGGGPSGTCVGQVAAVVIHGSADTTVNVSSGEKSRDYWLKANHCGTTTVAMEPSPCVVYQGCDPGFPVAWCLHSGGHQINSNFFGPSIWNFISPL